MPRALRVLGATPLMTPNLPDLDHREFARLIHYLLVQMGHDVNAHDRVGGPVIDFVLTDRHQPSERTIVETKRYRRPVGAEAVLQLRGALDLAAASSALLITTSSFTTAAQEATQNAPIQLIDGAALLQLLTDHGIHAKIEFNDS